MDLTNLLINPETNKRCGGESEKKFVEEMKTFNNLILYLRLNSSFVNKSLEKLSIVPVYNWGIKRIDYEAYFLGSG